MLSIRIKVILTVTQLHSNPQSHSHTQSQSTESHRHTATQQSRSTNPTADPEFRPVAHTIAERNTLLLSSRIGHPFLVGLRAAFQTRACLYLVMDYMPCGDLYHHLRKEQRFTEESRQPPSTISLYLLAAPCSSLKLVYP